jgi:hypothetical protein
LSVTKPYRKPYIKPRKGAFLQIEEEEDDNTKMNQKESSVTINTTDGAKLKEEINDGRKVSIEANILSVNLSLSNLTISSNNEDMHISVSNNHNSVEPEFGRNSTESTDENLISDKDEFVDNNSNELLSHSNQNEQGVKFEEVTIETTTDAAISTESKTEVGKTTVEAIMILPEAVGYKLIIDEIATETIAAAAVSEVSEIRTIKQTVEATADDIETVDTAELKVDSVIELELLVPPCNPVKSSSSQVSLRDCLSSFTREEILSSSDNNGFYCAKCSPTKGLVNAQKRILLLDCPMMLSIHLKRLLSGGKFSGHVDFPLQLNIKDFKALRKDIHKKEKDSDDKPEVVNDSIKDSPDVEDSKSDEGMTDTDSHAVNIDDNQTESDFKDVIYDLCSVIVHQGSSLGGHYVAYVRNKKGDWFYCSDTTVRGCAEADVLRAQAYMLYYQSRDIKFDSVHGMNNDDVKDQDVNGSNVVNENNQKIENEGYANPIDSGDVLDNNHIEIAKGNDKHILIGNDINVDVDPGECTTDVTSNVDKISIVKEIVSKDKQTNKTVSDESYCDVNLDLNVYSSTKNLASRFKKTKEISSDESNSRTRLSRKCKVGP